MRIIVIGASGVIGSAVAKNLSSGSPVHEVIGASRSAGDPRVDIESRESIDAFYEAVGSFDAVVCCAGSASFGPLDGLSDEDFQLGLRSKMMGQINLVRSGLARVADGGSFTLTSGVLFDEPIPGSAALALVNGALIGFVRAAALELSRGVRINVVSPPWVAETLEAMGRDPSSGMTAAKVAITYREAAEGARSGEVLDARAFV